MTLFYYHPHEKKQYIYSQSSYTGLVRLMGNADLMGINPAEPAIRKDYSKISIYAYFSYFMHIIHAPIDDFLVKL